GVRGRTGYCPLPVAGGRLLSGARVAVTDGARRSPKVRLCHAGRGIALTPCLARQVTRVRVPDRVGSDYSGSNVWLWLIATHPLLGRIHLSAIPPTSARWP